MNTYHTTLALVLLVAVWFAVRIITRARRGHDLARARDQAVRRWYSVDHH